MQMTPPTQKKKNTNICYQPDGLRLCLAHTAVVKHQHAKVLKSRPQKLLLHLLLISTVFQILFSQQRLHKLTFYVSNISFPQI